MPKCDWSGCHKSAIGGFVETGDTHSSEDTHSSTETDGLLISETYWCEDHEKRMSEGLKGKPGRRMTFDR
jgi:hypothetical protein